MSIVIKSNLAHIKLIQKCSPQSSIRLQTLLQKEKKSYLKQDDSYFEDQSMSLKSHIKCIFENSAVTLMNCVFSSNLAPLF